MTKSIMKALIIPYLLVSAMIFYALYVLLDPDDLIVVLNSLFIGTMISISVSYGQILFPAIFGARPYDDVRVLSIGIFGNWLAYGIVVYGSIYVRAADMPTTTLAVTAFGRWVAINSAVIQIIAPDFNTSFSPTYGRDRRLLIAGLFLGVIVSSLVFWAQDNQIIARG